VVPLEEEAAGTGVSVARRHPLKPITTDAITQICTADIHFTGSPFSDTA
jgi:hypothetical protein